MIRRPPRSTQSRSSAASDVYKRQPLDKELSLEVGFIARYKEGGEGTLKVSVTDNEGNEVAGKTWKVKSGDRQQVDTLKYSMTQSSGKPLEARAELKVTSDDKTAMGAGSLTYKSVAGKGKNLKLKEAKDRALAKLQAVSYTHLRAHETRHDLVCRLLLEK